jgi:hypothetical protein
MIEELDDEVLNKRHGIIAVYMNLMCVVGRVYCCYY